MGTKTALIAFLAVGIIALGSTLASADNAKNAERLAQESEAACVATAATKATPQMIIDKVNAACEIIEKEGSASFSKFQGKDSDFIFAGTYIWINSFDGIMLMHPIKHGLNGHRVMDFRDSNGKLYFIEFIETCKNKGAGWVEYMWPKPGQKEAVHKASYVKRAKLNGQDVVVGCGSYDLNMKEIQKMMQ